MGALSDRALNRATLARQLLLHREKLSAVEAVRRIVAVQAQEFASPYVALWNRVDGFDPAALDAAFADHSIIRATLMRVTKHAVAAEDYPPFYNAMAPDLRDARVYDRRYAASGLTEADADDLLPHVLAFAKSARTRPEMEDFIAGRSGGPRPWAWWALKTYAPLMHAPTGGPWSFGPRAARGAAPGTLPAEQREASLAHLVRRDLAGFGPASVLDIARFTQLGRATIRAGVRRLGDELTELPGPGGVTLLDVPGAPRPDEDTPAPPRLLAMWDSVLLAYADHGRMMPPGYRPIIRRGNGDVLPTLLVDGHVAGVWRPVAGGIEATAFHKLPKAAWTGLAAEAAGMVTFLAGREPLAYSRYGHWWTKGLPAAEVRTLPG